MLAPLLLKVTAPVSALLCVKVMALPPAVKLEVPGTVKAPVCVMAPPAVTEIDPPLFKVKVGKAMAAPLKFRVKLRKAVSEEKLVGKVAAALELVKLKSCTLPRVAPAAKATAPLILLAWVRRILDAAVFSIRVKVPVAEAACVRAPV